MATARLKNTGPAKGRRGQPPRQPTCQVCGQPINPGQQRWEWSFRYGGTYAQHETCGRPRKSATTQGSVSALYAAQEEVEDALAADTGDDFESWRSDVEQALNNAAEVARDMAGEYEAAAEPFGGQGPNQERAEACEAWADALDDAASNVADVDVDEPNEPTDWPDTGDTSDAACTIREAHQAALEQAVSDARDEVGGIAEGGAYELEL